MSNKIKSRLSLCAASLALTIFGLGIQGKADITPQDNTSHQTTVQTKDYTGSSSTIDQESKNDDSVSYKDADDNQVKAPDESSSSTDKNDSSSDATRSKSSTSDQSKQDDTGEVSTTVDGSSQDGHTANSDADASDQTAQTTKSTAIDSTTNSSATVDNRTATSASSTSSTKSTKAVKNSQTDSAMPSGTVNQEMTGIAKQSTASKATGIDETLKSIIDQIIPDEQPKADASSESDNKTTLRSANGAIMVNPNQFPINKRSRIEKTVTSEDIRKDNPMKTVLPIDNNYRNIKSKAKLVTFDAFTDSYYQTVNKRRARPGELTTTNGDKVTITTPVSKAKYKMNDQSGVSDMWPLIATVSIIGLAGLSFFAFDPLRFLFK